MIPKNDGHFERRAQSCYLILFKRVNFRQYFICLCERLSNCCNVLTSSESWRSRSNSKRLSAGYRYYLSMDAIFFDNFGGDTDMCHCSRHGV